MSKEWAPDKKDEEIGEQPLRETQEFQLCKEKIKSILEKGEKLDEMTLKGFRYLIDGYIEKSSKCFDLVAENREDEPVVFYGKGVINLLMGDLHKAVRFFEKSISLKPEFNEAWHEKGVALYELDRSEEALECWKKARETVE
ncbi:MAG: hypothetical protein V5A88_07290 [Candidatus Thermoplasmatota archaeon]